MIKILIAFGTRPEAIKLIPVIYEIQKYPQLFNVKVCNTSQHKQMTQEVLDIFNIIPDFNLDIMKENQDLFDITSNVLLRLKNILDEFNPNLVLVHGDTTTAFVSSLAAFYKQIDVGHIEAGLRTNNIYNPFPEELNRQFISKIAKLNFAPTNQAKENLLQENIKEDTIIITGNTVIDTLYITLKKVKQKNYLNSHPYLNNEQLIVLVTLHRRENIGEAFINTFEALEYIAINNPQINIVYPVHPNPNVKGLAYKMLNKIDNIFLIDPLPYDQFISLMYQSIFIITDSGGIQEEASSLGKPILIIRKTTERKELLELDTIKLVGTQRDEIIKNAQTFLDSKIFLNTKKNLFYGDGNASMKIVSFIRKFYHAKY